MSYHRRLKMLDLVKNNISWVKDVLWVVFTLVATVIAVLTYKRAKSTILQPIRSETIKKQAILLEDLLTFIKGDVDYSELLEINVLYILMEYGFLFKDQSELCKELKQRSAGLLITTPKRQLDFLEVIQPFEEQSVEEQPKLSKEKCKKALKEGIVEVEVVHIPKSFVDYNNQLDDFINNPFLPKRFQNILLSLRRDVSYNSSVALKNTLEEFLKQYINRYKKGQKDFNIAGIYNNYQRTLIKSNKSKDDLYNEIRKYLFIDYEWK